MINERKTIDLKKTYAALFTAPVRKAAVVDVPNLRFLAIDGSGHPSGEAFQEAVSALYPVAYLLKFLVRDRLAVDYNVAPLEVRWKVDRVQKTFAWRAVLLQPAWITMELFEEACQKAASKASPDVLARVRLEDFTEGLCGQILHRGPYEGMNDTLARLTASLKAQGYRAGQETHDIYLNDMRRTKPENLRAIMRVAVQNISKD